jgi:adenosylcobyric acid synthase
MSVKAACLAVLGTGSDVGKSIVTTALCRILADRGVRVAPFKAQNMSNNSGVTPEGLEMGRAQIVQAEAARVSPHVDMNPVLLKPTSDVGSQVVLNGRAWLDASSKSYYQKKEFLWSQCCAALDRLRRRYEAVVMEGAGSCAEVNLMDDDIVNLRAAAFADAPVILVADIDRGGVFAQIIGTLACLSPRQREQIKGFIINRFRGDLDLFRPGQDWIEQETGKRVFGVLPWYEHFNIEAEDAVVIDAAERRTPVRSSMPAVAVIRLPHISNFNDFDPLAGLDGLQLDYLKRPRPLSSYRAVIVPGTKSTRSDLAWMESTGWTAALREYHANGGHLLGICGGYQMLGRRVVDPDGLEGPAGETAGLNLLALETELKAPKTTTRTVFAWNGIQGSGYEIHMGQTRLLNGRPLLEVVRRNLQACNSEDGCTSPDGRVLGTYIHGFFDTPAITRQWLALIGLDKIRVDRRHGPVARDRAYDLLAEHTIRHIDVDGILDLIGYTLAR